jgi:quercetin dioxygenase-like cupin family protein
MSISIQTSHTPSIVRVSTGKDRFGERHQFGTSSFDFKVSTAGENGIFIIENTFQEKGGPARHVHHYQKEWLYAIEGEFLVEVGDTKLRLQPGDSVLLPCKIPHVWAFVNGTRGRILLTYTPAGNIETFFREITNPNGKSPRDPDLWRAHGMDVLGPPLALD